MKVVLDTDVVLAAVLSERGASRQLLLRIVDGLLPAAISVPLILEYEAVLKRPEHRRASGMSLDDVDIILDQVAASMQHVRCSSCGGRNCAMPRTTWFWKRRSTDRRR